MGRRLGLVMACVALLAVAAVPAGTAAPAPAASAPAESTTVPASWFGGTPALADGQIELAVVSSLPATVTGEDARIEVRGVQASDIVRVDRDGTDVSASLQPV